MGDSPKAYASLFTVVLLIFVSFCCGCGDDNSNGGTDPRIRHPQDFFPQAIGGLSTDGSPRTATTETELQEVVDGGYETYTSHNFKEFAERVYVGTVGGSDVELTAWIFELDSAADAAELYDDERVDVGGCEEIDEIGNRQRLCRQLVHQIMQIQRNEYWIQLTIMSTSEDARQILDLLATHIDGEIVG